MTTTATRRAAPHRAAPLSAFVAALLAPAAPVLAADAPRVSLDWHAPAGCPERDALLARVEQLVGERVGAPRGSPLDVRELVTLTADGRFRAELGIVQGGAERSRTFDAPSCSEIAEASALVMALALAPDTGADETSAPRLAMPPLEPPPPPPPEPNAQSRDTVTPPPRRPSGSPSSLRPRVDAGVAVDLGAIAAAAPGVLLAGGVRFGRYVDLGLRGSFFPARSTSLPARPNEGVRLLLAELTPAACAEPLPGLPVELGACALFGFGLLQASGFGPLLPYHRSASWLAPGAGLTVAYPARGRFRSRFGADALFPLVQTAFILTNAGTARTLPTVAPRLGMALELVFP